MTASQLTHAERLALFQRQQQYRKHKQFGLPSEAATVTQPPVPAQPAPGSPTAAPTPRTPTTRRPIPAAADQTVRLRLHVLSGPDAGAQFELPQGEFVIGRGDDADLYLTDDTVSHHHAKIVVSGRRGTIEDLRSLNGTLLGEVSLRGVAILRPGDRVKIGDTHLEVEAGDVPE
jgi:pSer/pThr/pTyr-binding forkhead associated (FHA) protein